MINENIIRADLPNPNTEPELYIKVRENQIHNCNLKCGGPAAPGHICKKDFLVPFLYIHILILILNVIFINVLNLKING